MNDMPGSPNSRNKPIVTPIAADNIDLLQLHSEFTSKYPYLLQSVAQPDGQPGYDILFAYPQFFLELDAQENLKIDGADNIAVSQAEFNSSDFLQAFENLWQRENNGWEGDCELPFSGGWFLFLGYELVRQIEPCLIKGSLQDNRFPVAVAARVPAAIIFSHKDQSYCMVVEENSHELRVKIQEDIAAIRKSQTNAAGNDNVSGKIITSLEEDEPGQYTDNVRRIKKYIKEGDVFQVNLSRQWQAKLPDDVSSSQIYRRLTRTNPAPFFALAEFGENAVISSSPERLVKTSKRNIDTRPIAGTRPRGETSDGDKANLDELIGHPKERAEHIMLIDLERNDLGRVCKPGSVKVNELMVLETYSHVHHIVSNVQGELRDDVTPSDVIKAVFPGGTITGCPKVRCMEIINELEDKVRGPYTGSLGYVNHSGDMDLNILIRTLVKHKDTLSLRAGAGIVADSDPQFELEETRAKAKGLLLAL